MDAVVKSYNVVFYEMSDPRLKDWPLMSSPWPIFFILTTYLCMVKICLPAFMRDRKPYDLKNIIKWYNVIQIFSNAIVTWGLFTSGWTTTYSLVGCTVPDYSDNPEALRMLRFMWWTVILKLMELPETIFFILRKRERQASFLHVYHHTSSLLIIWVGTKYVGGGLVSFPPMLNNAVHVVMYSYYYLSMEGSPATKAFLAKYKKWITIMQMVQFTVMLIICAQVLLPSCQIPKNIGYFYFPNVIFVYYMFYNFYQKNYNRRASLKNSQYSKLKGELNGKVH